MNDKKKKPAETLTEIDKLLDTVLNILTKLALAAMSVKTIIEILTLKIIAHKREFVNKIILISKKEVD